ncbi:iron ABC transporter permease, partial [Streptomyces sp. JV190]|nr:iron ABC transporter permease [Streptomyces sp. JV190]
MAAAVGVGGVSFVWRPWAVVVSLLLVAAALRVFCLCLCVGDLPFGLSGLMCTFLGRGVEVDVFVG